MKTEYIDELNEIRASAAFKARAAAAMEKAEQGRAHAKNAPAPRISFARRKPLAFAAILAAALLLCAGTAFAIYQSTASRVSETLEAAANIQDDDLQKQAEAYADKYLDGWTLTVPIEGGQELPGLRMSLKSIEHFGTELWVYFSVESLEKELGVIYYHDSDFMTPSRWERVKDCTRLVDIGENAFTFGLKIDGKDYALYTHAKESGDPAAWIGRDEDPGVSFLTVPKDIAPGTPMTLYGSFQSTDKDFNNPEAIGDFSIDFTYPDSTALREAKRQEVIADYKANYLPAAQERAQAAAALPQEAAAIGITDGNITVNDITRTEDGGLLVGYTFNPESGSLDPFVDAYMDGYFANCQIIETADVNTGAEGGATPSLNSWEHASTVNLILKYQPYAAEAKLPESSLFVLHSDAQDFGAQNMDNSGAIIDMGAQAEFTAVFRYTWKTGAVTLPKDDAEKQAWLAESEAKQNDGRNDLRVYNYNDHNAGDPAPKPLDSVNGVDFSLFNIFALPNGKLAIQYRVGFMRCELIAWESCPKIKVNGVPVEVENLHADWETDLTEWPEVYWEYVEEKQRWMFDVWVVTLPERIDQMPENFDIEIEWTLSDVTKDMVREEIGTFHAVYSIERDNYRKETPPYMSWEGYMYNY